MNDEVIDTFKYELRNLEWPGEVLEKLPGVTRRCSLDGAMNLVMAHDLDASAADKAVVEELAHFKALGRNFEWKVFSYDRPVDLLGRLAAAGMRMGDHESVVVYDLNGGLEPLLGEFECTISRIERIEDLEDFRTVAEEVFGKDYAFTTNQLADEIRAGRRGHDGYIGFVDGIPATVGRLYTNPKSAFAGLYGGGTKAQYRGRGCYRAMVADRAKDAIERGARYLQVDAMPTSLPILLRLGFVKIADTWPLEAPNSPTEP